MASKMAWRSIPLLLLLFLASCRAAGNDRGEIAPPWPTEGWETADPEDLGLDGELLQGILEEIQAEGLALHSLVVVYRGVIVMEYYLPPYLPDSQQEIHSITKSILSGLVGIAIDRGYFSSIADPILDYFPDLEIENDAAEKRSITLENLLTMSSGLSGDLESFQADQNWVQETLDQPMSFSPGSAFSYQSGNTHLLSAAIEQSSNLSTRDFADLYLFKPLGITDYSWDRDPQGVNIGAWGLRMKSRDLAKIGYLYLREGIWDSQQIIPQEWVRASVHPQYRVPDALEPWGLSMGYSWWVHNDGPFAAHGSGGQFIYVIPDADLVVVMTADVPDEQFARLQILIREYILPAVPAD